MKLSKQERIAVIVIAVLVIIAIGVFVFIKPNIETINSTQATLDGKTAELAEAKAKAATKESLKEQILAAYDKGKDTADMFFPEMKTYEVDNEVRAFLEQCEAEIIVESLELSGPETATLSTSVFVPASVSYALKDYVNQGVTTDITKTDPNLIRQVLIQAALGEAQNIGASTATFVVKSLTKEELLKFADEVNDYVKKENGKDVRKAVSIDNITFEDPILKEEWENRANGEEGSGSNRRTANAAATPPEADAPGTDAPSTPSPDTPSPTPGTPGTPNTPNTPTVDPDDVEAFYELTVTMTFYSIERMQDPTDTLKAQDTPVA